MTDRTHITPGELATQRGISVNKILAWIHRGELEALDVSGTPGRGRPRWRISLDALERFDRRRLNTSRIAPTARRRTTASGVGQWF